MVLYRNSSTATTINVTVNNTGTSSVTTKRLTFPHSAVGYYENGVGGYLIVEESSFCTFTDLNTHASTYYLIDATEGTNYYSWSWPSTTLDYNAPIMVLNGTTYTRIQLNNKPIMEALQTALEATPFNA